MEAPRTLNQKVEHTLFMYPQFVLPPVAWKIGKPPNLPYFKQIIRYYTLSKSVNDW